MTLGCGFPGSMCRSVAAGTLVLFALLAGPQPSVVRVVLMGAVALTAVKCGKRTRPVGVLLLNLL